MIKTKGKNVTVVGLARSGAGAANLLSELGAHVTVTDIKSEKELKDVIPRLNPLVKLALGSHPEDIFVKADMLIISPGVPLDIPPLLLAKTKGIPIIGELELAYQVIQSIVSSQQSLIKTNKQSVNSQLSTLNSSPYFLAVTGTNGKSTTTALLDFMMRKGGFKTILGGNIGNALTEEIQKLRRWEDEKLRNTNNSQPLILSTSQLPDFIVAEISSFQLESIIDFRPKVAAIINITPDHLNRYHSLEEYSDAKARIFENQQEDDFLVLNWDDPETMKVFRDKFGVRSPQATRRGESSEFPKIFFFSRKEEVNGVYSKNGVVYCSLNNSELMTQNFELIKADEIKIKGVHNLENAMAASAMALLAGCPLEAVIDSLKEFPGLEHRLEFVREIDGVSYFNDSKGTNVGAVIKSLESFSRPIILIAGGRDKAGEFSLLRHLVRERVKAIVLIGEASEKIKKALGDITDTVMAGDLRDAVYVSKSMAVKGDVVLLSPACASFDMFANFEDRGRQFKKIVMEMK